MADTTTRALSLLNLLQTHRHWPGTELAERLAAFVDETRVLYPPVELESTG